MWLIGTVFVVVLLFSYRTSTSGPSAATSGGNAAYAPGVVSGTGSDSGSATGSATGATTDATINGSVAQTRWGPVQVQLKVSAGKIVDVVVLQQPNGNRRDDEINSYALPVLRTEVLQAQSANIDGVSGATVTSDGYRESLQSALSLAHLGG